jgi:hypothetical protein
MQKAWIGLVLVLLTSCGGGGGGSGGNLGAPSSGVFGAATLAGTFSYYRDGSTNNPVSFLHAQDLDGDGVDEVIMVAFETQPNTPANYSNTGVRIWGWRTGVFQDLTSHWLPGGIDQVGGVGDIAFGDFDGDGRLDVFLSAYTDMEHPVQAYALMNRGGFFDRVALGEQEWQHAVAAADVNGDGYTDVIVAGYSVNSPQYMGSAAGLVPYQGMVGSSGVTLGNFFGDTRVQAVFTDADLQSGRSGANDAALYEIVVDNTNRTVAFNRLGPLPQPRLIAVEDGSFSSHDIRARSVDFDGDGLLDVVVFSYLWPGPVAEGAYRSEIQFLRNMGGGTFSDVTSTVRVGYDTTGFVGYTPVFRDFNGDGRVDMFVSDADFFSSGRHKSSTLFIQQPDKTFRDTAKADLSNVIASAGGKGVMAKGPANKWYLVKEGAWQRDGLTRVWLHPVSGL